MSNQSPIKLSSTEISSLWLTYYNDSLVTKMLKYFKNNVSDEEVRAQLETAYNISDKHLKFIEQVFRNDGLTIPVGFSEQDVNENAPRLFRDVYYLYYLSNIALYGMTNFNLYLYRTARTDVRKFFSEGEIEMTQFYYNLSDLMLNKGVFLRAPIVEVTKEIDFVNKKDFFAGIFTEPRSLLLMEISNIYANILTCLTGRTLIQGFSQVTNSNEIKKFLHDGKEMLDRHVNFFAGLLEAEDIPVPAMSDTFLTDSTQAPFTDKLMLYHATVLNIIHIRNFSDAIATSMRKDITVGFTRLLGEIGRFASEGVGIMVKNGWMEQPPQAVNQRELVGV